MESMSVTESSLPSEKVQIAPTIDTVPETKPEQSITKARSGKQTKSSQIESSSFLPTLEEFLPIFQEDLRVLRSIGAKFQIFPNLKGVDKLVLVFDNISYKDGDLEITKGK